MVKAFSLLTVLNFALTALPTIYAQGGEPLGLMDLNGREVLAAKYSEVRYLGSGLYLTRDMAPGLAPGNKYFLVNREGKQLKVRVPSGAEFTGVYSLGSSPSTTENTSSSLPDDAIIVFSSQNKFGLCDPAGREIYRPGTAP